MYTIEVRIKGTRPLLMHRNPLPEEGDPVIKKVTGMSKEAQKYMVDFEKSKYKMEDGTLYQPAAAIHKCLTESALNFQIPGKGKKTYKGLVVGSLLVEPEMIVHEIQEAVPDRRWVRIQTSRIVRTRARLDEWALSFRLLVADDQFPEEALKQIIEYAAVSKGLGDYRPVFGRFIVAKFERLKPAKAEESNVGTS